LHYLLLLANEPDSAITKTASRMAVSRALLRVHDALASALRPLVGEPNTAAGKPLPVQ